MKKLRENLTIYTIGSVGYSFLEILWRGFTHWTMGITGGVCFLCLYKTNIKMNRQPLWKRCLTGSAIVTGIEFAVGCIVNIKLKWNVWDYSKMHFNLAGQVCLLYSVLWFFLCMPVSFLSRVLHRKIERGTHR